MDYLAFYNVRATGLSLCKLLCVIPYLNKVVICLLVSSGIFICPSLHIVGFDWHKHFIFVLVSGHSEDFHTACQVPWLTCQTLERPCTSGWIAGRFNPDHYLINFMNNNSHSTRKVHKSYSECKTTHWNSTCRTVVKRFVALIKTLGMCFPF